MTHVPEDVAEAYRILFEDVFYKIMMGAIKAKPNDPVYLGLSKTNRELTKKDVHEIADYASAYFVKHANPSVGKLSKSKVARLQGRSIRHALKKFAVAHGN